MTRDLSERPSWALFAAIAVLIAVASVLCVAPVQAADVTQLGPVLVDHGGIHGRIALTPPPPTSCGVLCSGPKASADRFCQGECGPTAKCSQALCDNCGGTCILITAIP